MEINMMKDGLVAGSKFQFKSTFFKPAAIIAAGFLFALR